MATRGPELMPIALAYGDVLLQRLCVEHLRLERQQLVLSEEMERRRMEIVDGLASRNVTRLEMGDVTVRRQGRDGLVITSAVPVPRLSW